MIACWRLLPVQIFVHTATSHRRRSPNCPRCNTNSAVIWKLPLDALWNQILIVLLSEILLVHFNPCWWDHSLYLHFFLWNPDSRTVLVCWATVCLAFNWPACVTLLKMYLWLFGLFLSVTNGQVMFGMSAYIDAVTTGQHPFYIKGLTNRNSLYEMSPEHVWGVITSCEWSHWKAGLEINCTEVITVNTLGQFLLQGIHSKEFKKETPLLVSSGLFVLSNASQAVTRKSYWLTGNSSIGHIVGASWEPTRGNQFPEADNKSHCTLLLLMGLFTSFLPVWCHKQITFTTSRTF